MIRKQNLPKRSRSHNALTLTIDDAVTAADMVSSSIESAAQSIAYRQSGLPFVFKASQEAVAKIKPVNINHRTFDAALEAARVAMEDSDIPSTYKKMHKIIMSIPDYLVSMAAKHAANDLFTSMPVKARTSDGGRLLEDMKDAAIKTARVHIRRDECIPQLQAATHDAEKIAAITVLMTAEIVQTGVSAHAATAAVFGAAIQKVPPNRLTRAIEKACADLPKLARRHSGILGLVTEISTTILNDAIYRRKYQTAISGAEKLSRKDATVQVCNMIIGNTFEAVYMTLITGIYAISDKSTFESGYEEALAAACGIKSFDTQQATMGDTSDDPTSNLENIPPEVLQELYQKLSNKLGYVLGSEENPASRRLYTNALEVDYEAYASSDGSNNIISLYEIAYRAGYKGAGAAAGKPDG